MLDYSILEKERDAEEYDYCYYLSFLFYIPRGQ